VLFTLMPFSITAEEFSRRPHHSEVGQSQGQTTPLDHQIQTHTTQAVPEPSSFLLLGIGIGVIGVFAIVSMRKQSRGQDA
jgi:PEP-CTERM motif